MLETVKSMYQFLKDVANDERIPQRDKTILLGLLALLISPFDIIPDWIPILGQLDDIVILALIADYFFNKLDDEVLLAHWPWGMKRFIALKKYARMIAWITPDKLKDKVWSYRASPYT